jgi:ectoine hydroxylase-related dioxygenase (phytanoyl-CoA dioxygenase family)
MWQDPCHTVRPDPEDHMALAEPMTIPRFDRDVTPAEVSVALQTHGCAVVERLADDDLCDRVAAELAPHIAETPTGGDDFTGAQTRRTGALLARSPSSVEMVAHPLVLDVCDQVLWERKTTFQLHLTQAITIGPGAEAQYLHRDQWCFDFFPFPDDVQVEVSTIWALDDFTEANGATRVIPGSHLASDPRGYTPDDTIPAVMPRGSVVLYTGRTVHGGGANTSDGTRTGVNVDYVLGWLRQEENQYLSVPIDVVRTLPERVQRLMGYDMGAYALGYIDDVRNPMALLRDPTDDPAPADEGSSFAPRP